MTWRGHTSPHCVLPISSFVLVLFLALPIYSRNTIYKFVNYFKIKHISQLYLSANAQADETGRSYPTQIPSEAELMREPFKKN